MVNKRVVEYNEGFRELFVFATIEAFCEDTFCVMDVVCYGVLCTITGCLGETIHLAGYYLSNNLQGTGKYIALSEFGGCHFIGKIIG